MKTLALVVAVAVTVSSVTARAEAPFDRPRGGLSALGLVLLGVGVGALGLGVGGVAMTSDVSAVLTVYAPGGVAMQRDAAFVRTLLDRQTSGTTLAIASFIGAAALIAGGVVCLVLDTPQSLTIGFLPTHDGGVLTASLRW